MSTLKALYQQLILDHNQNPRNFKHLIDAAQSCHGHNPVCGDEYSVFVVLEESRIQDISFYGTGCAISKASASLMTVEVHGKVLESVYHVFDEFHKMISGESADTQRLGKLIVFEGVSEFPARVKCASLAWHTLLCALKKEKQITTE